MTDVDMHVHSLTELPPIEGYLVQQCQPYKEPPYYYYQKLEEKKEEAPIRVRQARRAVPRTTRAQPQPRPRQQRAEAVDQEALPDRGTEPGEESDPNRARCFNNTAMIVTYKSHLNKQEYESWFREKVVPKYSGGGENEVIFFRMAHETGDKACPYLHTHMVYKTRYPIYTRDCRALDYEEIHPNWRYLNTNTHYNNAVRYLAKEDPDNADLRYGDGQAWKHTVEGSSNIKEAIRNTRCRPGDISGLERYFQIVNKPEVQPKLAPANFLRWQLELYEILNNNSVPKPPLPKIFDPADRTKRERVPIPELAQVYDNSDRTLTMVLDRKGGAGKTQFIKALHYHEPNRFLIVQGVPQAKDFGTQIQDAQLSGWTGDAILFNLTRTQADYKIHNTLEATIDGFITAVKYRGGTIVFEPKSVVIFTNAIPCLTKVTMDRWKIYKVEADFKKGDMSWLDPMSVEEALQVYQEQLDEMTPEERAEYLDEEPHRVEGIRPRARARR